MHASVPARWCGSAGDCTPMRAGASRGRGGCVSLDGSSKVLWRDNDSDGSYEDSDEDDEVGYGRGRGPYQESSMGKCIWRCACCACVVLMALSFIGTYEVYGAEAHAKCLRDSRCASVMATAAVAFTKTREQLEQLPVDKIREGGMKRIQRIINRASKSDGDTEDPPPPEGTDGHIHRFERDPSRLAHHPPVPEQLAPEPAAAPTAQQQQQAASDAAEAFLPQLASTSSHERHDERHAEHRDERQHARGEHGGDHNDGNQLGDSSAVLGGLSSATLDAADSGGSDGMASPKAPQPTMALPTTALPTASSAQVGLETSQLPPALKSNARSAVLSTSAKCVAVGSKCGGRGWAGSTTCCARGDGPAPRCYRRNAYHSQCRISCVGLAGWECTVAAASPAAPLPAAPLAPAAAARVEEIEQSVKRLASREALLRAATPSAAASAAPALLTSPPPPSPLPSPTPAPAETFAESVASAASPPPPPLTEAAVEVASPPPPPPPPLPLPISSPPPPARAPTAARPQSCFSAIPNDVPHAQCQSFCNAKNAKGHCRYCKCRRCPFCTSSSTAAAPAAASASAAAPRAAFAPSPRSDPTEAAQPLGDHEGRYSVPTPQQSAQAPAAAEPTPTPASRGRGAFGKGRGAPGVGPGRGGAGKGDGRGGAFLGKGRGSRRK